MEDITPKKIGLVVAGSLLVLGILFGAWNMTSKPTVVAPQDMSISEDDHITANKKAKVVLVEYSDFQCPACGQYHPLVKEILKKHEKNISFIYRHFPLDQHKNAIPAARAAEAAGKQGKFFEMADLLFVNQDTWGESDDAQKYFEEYATKLKLNMEQFKKDNSKEADVKIQKDKNSGLALGVNSTPTFYLNGVKLSNPKSVDEFNRLINEALAAKK